MGDAQQSYFYNIHICVDSLILTIQEATALNKGTNCARLNLGVNIFRYGYLLVFYKDSIHNWKQNTRDKGDSLLVVIFKVELIGINTLLKYLRNILELFEQIC